MNRSDSPWVKASSSDANGNCVELRRHQGTVQVRDTKDAGTGPVLNLSPAEMAAWLDGARKGEFNRLASS